MPKSRSMKLRYTRAWASRLRLMDPTTLLESSSPSSRGQFRRERALRLGPRRRFRKGIPQSMGRDIDVQGRGPTSRSSSLTPRIVAEIDLGIKFVGGIRANDIARWGPIVRTLARISISLDFALVDYSTCARVNFSNAKRAPQSSRNRAAGAKTDNRG